MLCKDLNWKVIHIVQTFQTIQDSNGRICLTFRVYLSVDENDMIGQRLQSNQISVLSRCNTSQTHTEAMVETDLSIDFCKGIKNLQFQDLDPKFYGSRPLLPRQNMRGKRSQHCRSASKMWKEKETLLERQYRGH